MVKCSSDALENTDFCSFCWLFSLWRHTHPKCHPLFTSISCVCFKLHVSLVLTEKWFRCGGSVFIVIIVLKADLYYYKHKTLHLSSGVMELYFILCSLKASQLVCCGFMKLFVRSPVVWSICLQRKKKMEANLIKWRDNRKISPRTWSPTHNTAETSRTKQKNGKVYSLTSTRVSRLYSSFLLTVLDDNVLEVLLADLPHT